MDDVINWCEERGIEIEHTDYGFKERPLNWPYSIAIPSFT